MVRLKNWCMTSNQNGYMAPEFIRYQLVGEVYGHQRFDDGTQITTSSIIDITDCKTYKIVKTMNTEYVVYPNEVNEEYEKTFPNAFKRLSLI